MSYIPDYRGEDNEKYLNDIDREYLRGFSLAIEYAKNAAEDVADTVGMDEDDKEEFLLLLECAEIETYCGVYESADYIPDDVLVDHNPPLYGRTKGAKKE